MIDGLSLQYAAWLVMWMTWNVFIICFYLEVGDLSRVRKCLFQGFHKRETGGHHRNYGPVCTFSPQHKGVTSDRDLGSSN